MSEKNEIEEEEAAEEIQLAEFGEKAIRAPKGGAFDRLLCQHLVLSVTSDPLNSIIHSCRAALSLSSEVAERLSIDKERTHDILVVALNFAQSKLSSDKYDVIWSFAALGEEGFRRYIQPWLTSTPTFYLPLKWKYDPGHAERFRGQPYWKRFYDGCRNLTPASFRALLSAFVAWAYPFVEELNNKVSTQVSPTTYQEILSMFQKFRGEEE